MFIKLFMQRSLGIEGVPIGREFGSKMTSVTAIVRLDVVDGGVRCDKSHWTIMVIGFFPHTGANAQ
jgi:hypothetical protein